jgi:hypothetical protein
VTGNHEKPDFLGHMFVSRGLGFSMAADAPMNLLDSLALQDENPWVVLAAIVERAKHGDFTYLPQVFDCLRRSEGDGAFWYACSDTLAHAAPSSVLRQLVTEFHSEIWEREDLWRIEYVVDVLRRSLRLWTVPIMLSIFLEIGDRKEIDEIDEDQDEPSLILVPDYLSQLLEEELGPIAEAELFDSDLNYQDLVTRTYEQRCRELGSSEAAILNGKPFSVRLIVEDLLAKVMDKGADSLGVAEERMLFEATTGVDCSAFFDNFQLRRLAATDVLEKFLESPHVNQYEPGVRYFFGHRIPD